MVEIEKEEIKTAATRELATSEAGVVVRIYIGSDNDTHKVHKAEAEEWAKVNLGSFSIYKYVKGYWYDTNEKKLYVENSIVIESIVTSADALPEDSKMQELRRITRQKEILVSVIPNTIIKYDGAVE